MTGGCLVDSLPAFPTDTGDVGVTLSRLVTEISSLLKVELQANDLAFLSRVQFGKNVKILAHFRAHFRLIEIRDLIQKF